MGDLLQPTHLIILAIVAFLLFGAKRLPELGKGLGEGLKGFKEGLKGVADPAPTAPAVQQSAAVASPTSATVNSKANMEYVTCSRCGGKFENPMGFKVVDFVCRNCQASS
jgi:sec-independent protein translocase protein TatA